MDKGSRIYVAGHRGLVGSAILHRLLQEGYSSLITRTSRELDLRDQAAVADLFASERIEYVFLAAAKVGGILANMTYPVEFIHDNQAIQTNVIHACHRFGVRKLLFLASSCVYPREAPQPMPESCLLAGPPEPTNEGYAIAKIGGIKMCEAYNRQYGTNFISAAPCNVYGPNDNFDLQSGHVVAALLRKFHEAKTSGSPYVIVWGTGTARREFLHVDDLADACLFLMRSYGRNELINVGAGSDVTILELAQLIREVVDYEGEIRLDRSRPDGIPRKLVEASKLYGLGWQPKIPLREGLKQTYEWFLDRYDEDRQDEGLRHGRRSSTCGK
ncbi:MAG: GDP-fucose synthetase [Chloroflexi bacterium RBG_13_54_8]|nr:MAG: GDP-fucose synthetase [Chloroflexi bacterium RBG_13_54_8]